MAAALYASICSVVDDGAFDVHNPKETGSSIGVKLLQKVHVLHIPFFLKLVMGRKCGMIQRSGWR